MQPNQFENTQVRGQEIDAGLRQYMSNIYVRMSTGVLVTAITAFIIGSSPALLNLFLGGPQAYVFMFAPLAVVMFGFRPHAMKAQHLMMAFFGIAVLYGISFASIAAVATQNAAFAMDVARAFFIATIMFGGLSVYGYTSKTDFSGMKTFLVMGMWGLIGAGIMNMIFPSGIMTNLIAGASILIFAGLTVYETQNIKESYNPSIGAEYLSRMGWAAALNLYISFIAMFQSILHFLQND